jgi:hypothetical protein
MEKGVVFLDKELSELFPELEKQGGNRFVDMLVKVFLKNGNEEWILVHIEIQGGSDKNFAERMFQYWYRIYGKDTGRRAEPGTVNGSQSADKE